MFDTFTRTCRPLASVIIPCYNAEPWIGECLDSAIAQTYRPLEIIVIDDGSTDNSLEVIKSYAQRYPDLIRYETGPNRGGCAARNRGFALSKGKYVKFLDADDLLSPDTLDVSVKCLEQNPEVIAIVPFQLLYYERKLDKWIPTPGPKRPDQFDDIQILLEAFYTGTPSLMFHRQTIVEVRGWNETLANSQEFDLLSRIIVPRIATFEWLTEGKAYYRQVTGSVSKSVSPSSIESKMTALGEFSNLLIHHGCFLSKYKVRISRIYHAWASVAWNVDRIKAQEALMLARRLGGRNSVNGPLVHQIICHLIGLENKKRLSNAFSYLRLK